MKEKISTRSAPGAIGPYAQGIRAGYLVFTSGQLPINPDTGEMPVGIEAQARHGLKNAESVLHAAGAGMSGVVKTTVYLKSMGDFAKVNAVYAGFFEAPFPARTCLEAARLPKDAEIEIECVAVID